MLIALRVGELTSKHFEILLGKVSRDTTEKFSIERALRIYPTDDRVARHNEKVLQSFEDKGTAIYTIKAQDQLIDATRNLHHMYFNVIIQNKIRRQSASSSGIESLQTANCKQIFFATAQIVAYYSKRTWI